MPYRVVLSFLLIVLSGISAIPKPQPTEAAAITASEFASIIGRISEPGGDFWNDNYVSNEASYLHPLKKMEEMGIKGGVYIGVGPNQNFTYIAKTKPRYAFIIDIRRQNLLEHLLFKGIFKLARNRSEYLSMLLGRPIEPGVFDDAGYTVADLVRYFGSAPQDMAFFSLIQQKLQPVIMDCGLDLSEQDWITIEKIHAAFYSRGLSIKYDYIPVGTYGEFLVEKDLEGKLQNFLNSDEDFSYLKKMQDENRILPIVGDFAGTHALKELGTYLRENNEKVMVFYTSNVEQYLVRNMVWPDFIRNVNELPFNDNAVFIRAHWSVYVSHPNEVEGYQFTQILQRAKTFLHKIQPDTSISYWDIVTADTINLR